MDTLLEIGNFPRLNQKEKENLNRLIITNKIKTIVKILPTNRSLVLMASQVNLTKHSKKK